MNHYQLSILAVIASIQFATSTLVISTAGLTTLTAYSAGALGAAVGGVLLGAKAGAAVGSALARGGGSRHRRQAADCLPFAGNSELYLLLAKSANSQDCGRRFVCELEATPDNLLSDDELLAKNVFK